MSLKSTLLTGTPESKEVDLTDQPDTELPTFTNNDDEKATQEDSNPPDQTNDNDEDDDEQAREHSVSGSHSLSLSSTQQKQKLDYTSQLRFYSQVGHIDRNNDVSDLPDDGALHVILPNSDNQTNICLGYSLGYKADDCMDIVDGDVWLYRAQNIANNNRVFYLCCFLSVAFLIDFILIFCILFHKDISFNVLNYNGGQSAFVAMYYAVLLISIIGCLVCIWWRFIRVLCLFAAAFITDLVFGLFWMEHYVQFLHWIAVIVICDLLRKYMTASFGRWNFLQSQSRLDELEQLHREGRF